MLKCSYIIYAHNNEETISNVVDSLKKINGNFRREYIIIDDGSSDNTLKIIKNVLKDLPHATIITHEYSGSALSINKALSLAKADYIYFASAVEPTPSTLPQKLIDSCIENNTEIAFSCISRMKNKKHAFETQIVIDPLKEILLNKIPNIRTIGSNGSLISYNLLMKIDGADERLYTLSSSLSLKCANFTGFTLIKQSGNLTKIHKNSKHNRDFERYNSLLAIYYYAEENPSACEKYKEELIYNLYKNVENTYSKASYFVRFILVKSICKYDLKQILLWYKKEIKKLF